MKKAVCRAALLLVVSGLLWCAGCARLMPPRKPAPPAGREEPTISLYVNQTGEKKNIKMEEYVAGVVAAEMDPTWPVNALAAQAILARTFTLENMKSGKVRNLHGTDASTSKEEFQAYDPSRINDNVRRAVDLTRGKVALYNGEYIKAWFNACDGGVSASAAEGLAFTEAPAPYVKAGVKDGCLSITVPENRYWERRIPLEKVRAAVQKITGRDPGPVTAVAVTRRGPSGRVEELKVGEVTVSGPALRMALGSDLVRSMLLTKVAVEGGSLVLAGKGFGHGVGMCQWGARLMAERGRSPEDILRFYFKDIEIRKLWD